MKRVFVIEPPRKLTVDGAREFGEIHYLFNSDTRRSSIFDVLNFTRDILDALTRNEYDPNTDYVCVTGSIITVSLMMAALGAKYKQFQILLFSSQQSKYVSKLFDMIPLLEPQPQETEHASSSGNNVDPLGTST